MGVHSVSTFFSPLAPVQTCVVDTVTLLVSPNALGVLGDASKNKNLIESAHSHVPSDWRFNSFENGRRRSGRWEQ